jgi:hypothetical protein
MMAKITRWEELEKAVQDELVLAQQCNPVAWHRFIDSKASGNIVARQPSDFVSCHQGNTVLIEAKFSEAHESLRNCFANAVKSHQLASARIWTRAGARYIVLFHSSLSGISECWNGLYLAECKSKGVKLSLDQRRLYDSVEQALAKEIGYA